MCCFRWVHIVCALYVPGVAFGDIDKLRPVTLTEMNYSKYGAKVSLEERYCQQVALFYIFTYHRITYVFPTLFLLFIAVAVWFRAKNEIKFVHGCYTIALPSLFLFSLPLFSIISILVFLPNFP